MSTRHQIIIIDRTKYGTFINHCFNLTALQSYLNLQNCDVGFEAVQDKIKNLAHVFLVVHSFDHWPQEEFKSFLDSIGSKVIVIPTQLADKATMLETFSHPKIDKLLIFSDFLNKYLTKSLGFHHEKIKHFNVNINLSITPLYKLTQEKILLVPSLVDGLKNFDFLLESFLMLNHLDKTRHNRFLYLVFFLQKSPLVNDTTFANFINQFNEKLSKMHKQATAHVKVITKSQYSYHDYLNAAYMILLPTKSNNNSVYSNLALDAIAAGKAIVAPEDNFETNIKLIKEGFIFDLCKNSAGMMLYKNNNVESLIESVSVIHENPSLRKILEEQNIELKYKLKNASSLKDLAIFIKKVAAK